MEETEPVFDKPSNPYYEGVNKDYRTQTREYNTLSELNHKRDYHIRKLIEIQTAIDATRKALN